MIMNDVEITHKKLIRWRKIVESYFCTKISVKMLEKKN